MFASPNSAKAATAIRYSTVAFSLAVLFWKAQTGVQENALVIYLVLLAVLMILAQAATSKDSRVADQSGRKTITAFDLFLIYIGSLLVIFARSLAGVQIPNFVMLCAILIAFCSGCYGIISTYRRRAYR